MRGKARAWRSLTAAAIVVFVGCAEAGFGWDEVDYCGPDGCVACTSDRDCISVSSCCGHTLFCLHRDEDFATCSLGCVEPEPPACRCERGRCRFE